jgi:hypothetical protein
MLALVLVLLLVVRSLTDTLSDLPAEEIACILCPRFCCQKCRHTLHAFLWSAALFDIHGSLCFNGHRYTQEDGRDVEDLEGAGPRIHRHQTSLPSRDHTPNRNSVDQG